MVTLGNRASINGNCSFTTSPQGFNLTVISGGASPSPTASPFVLSVAVRSVLTISDKIFILSRMHIVLRTPCRLRRINKKSRSSNDDRSYMLIGKTREISFAKIRTLSAWQASLLISERRNRTRACFARRVDCDGLTKNPDRHLTIGAIC